MKFITLNQDELGILADTIRVGLCDNATEEERLSADHARTTLMEAYAPLAVNSSKRFMGKLGQQEAISASFFGLAQALKTWNPDKGALPSHIRLFCKGALLREVDKMHIIRIPQVKASQRAMVKYWQAQGLSNEEVAEKMDIDITTVEKLSGLPAIAVWLDEHDQPLEDRLMTIPTSIDEADKLLCSLPDDERTVIEARFGINYDGLCHTMDEIADFTGWTIDKVRLLEVSAFERLRSSKNIDSQVS
jgi:DNA-directed RNA polymerase sigma subunit (sigma70/sigma32)